MSNPLKTHAIPNGSPIGLDKRFTLRTNKQDELTNTHQDPGSNSQVPDASRAVDNPVSVKWRIKKERIWLEGWTYSGMGWSLYYGRKRVARYRSWSKCCEHIATAHRRFGL